METVTIHAVIWSYYSDSPSLFLSFDENLAYEKFCEWSQSDDFNPDEDHVDIFPVLVSLPEHLSSRFTIGT